MMIVTTPYIEGREVQKYFGIVTLNSLGKDSTILEKEWGWKIRKAHISQDRFFVR